MHRILIIEDDPDIALSLKYNLERAGTFTIVVARSGEEGVREAAEHPPDLVVLDLNLPAMDGLDVCRKLRAGEATRRVPILMLTARIEETDKIVGLELGADDYVTKPFSVQEVLARIRALLRRAQGPADEQEVLASGDLEVDLAGRQVSVAGSAVVLTRKEFDLLVALMRQRGRVLTRDRLLERVWGYAHPGETRTVDVHVRQLRKKLGSAGAFIETVVGVGYRFGGAP